MKWNTHERKEDGHKDEKKPHGADDTQDFIFFFFFFAGVLGRAFNISISLLISVGYHTVLLIIGTVLCNRALELFSSSLTGTLYVLNNNFPLLFLAPSNHHSSPCFCEFDYFGDFI